MVYWSDHFFDSFYTSRDWVFLDGLLAKGSIGRVYRLGVMEPDLTDGKSAEQALSNSDELVRLILDSTAEAIFGCDPEGICLFCNQAAVRLLGYDDRAELLGKSMHALEHHTRPDGTPRKPPRAARSRRAARSGYRWASARLTSAVHASKNSGGGG